VFLSRGVRSFDDNQARRAKVNWTARPPAAPRKRDNADDVARSTDRQQETRQQSIPPHVSAILSLFRALN
jgi:hypothetical protein